MTRCTVGNKFDVIETKGKQNSLESAALLFKRTNKPKHSSQKLKTYNYYLATDTTKTGPNSLVPAVLIHTATYSYKEYMYPQTYFHLISEEMIMM